MTYWVEYEYSYHYWDTEERAWVAECGGDGARFHCRKKDVRKEVEKRIHEELEGEQIKNLKFEIYDMYPTTEYEI